MIKGVEDEIKENIKSAEIALKINRNLEIAKPMFATYEKFYQEELKKKQSDVDNKTAGDSTGTNMRE